MPEPSYAAGPRDVPLLTETIGEKLRGTAARFGDRDALVVRDQGYRATYAELWEQVGLAARAFLALGVEPGDRVGIWAPNCHEWVLTQYATARVGAILVNVNPAYKMTELEYVLGQSGAGVLVLARAFRQSDYAAMLADVRPRCPDLREAIVLEKDWAEFLASGHAVPEDQLAARESGLGADDPINIQYTSGTTGFPKGATLTHRNVLNNGHFIAETLEYTDADRVCVPVPFYHCFGMVIGNLACMTRGSCVVVPSRSFDPRAVLQAVSEERCTSLYGVPTMFIAELEHPEFGEFDLSTLRTGVMAGSPCPIETMRQVRSSMHMEAVTICYGMTETSPVSAQTSVDDPVEKRVTTVGRVHPHVELKVVDSVNGEVVPRGETGELCTRGYCVMRGYWRNDEATREAIDADGWMHTGDLAVMDDEGYLNIVGRSKDVIIRGGENIYPREIEEFLLTVPGVSEAYVIGVPSERYVEEVMAWVKLREGAELDEAALDAACRGRIATYKIPRYWKFVDEFPMTVTGKIQKFRMREASIEELGLAAVETA